MFEEENHNIEYKRLNAVDGKKNLEKLARECVCFANAQGGTVVIGIDDKTKEPPSDQKIDQDLMTRIQVISATSHYAVSSSKILPKKTS